MTQQNNSTEDLFNAIEQLEIKVAYQEHTIDSLNDEVTRQNRRIEQLTSQLNQVIERVKGLQPSQIAKASDEPPPPHY